MAGHHQVLAFLLENGGKQIIARDHIPLLMATRYGRTECVKLLLMAGADLSHTDAVLFIYFYAVLFL